MVTAIPRLLPQITRSWGIGLIALLSMPAASAHEGPPFPLLMDRPLGEYKVSLWADPDIGEARFFVILEPPGGEMPHQIPGVSLWTEPVSGRLPREAYSAKQQSLRNRVQFKAEPFFDQRDTWTVGVRVERPGGQPLEVTTQVESTPPGFGRWDLAIYLFPFLLLGGLWVVAMVRRQRERGMVLPQEEPDLSSGSQQPTHEHMAMGTDQGT